MSTVNKKYVGSQTSIEIKKAPCLLRCCKIKSTIACQLHRNFWCLEQTAKQPLFFSIETNLNALNLKKEYKSQNQWKKVWSMFSAIFHNIEYSLISGAHATCHFWVSLLKVVSLFSKCFSKLYRCQNFLCVLQNILIIINNYSKGSSIKDVTGKNDVFDSLSPLCHILSQLKTPLS